MDLVVQLEVFEFRVLAWGFISAVIVVAPNPFSWVVMRGVSGYVPYFLLT
jgi:hypothetical protein